MILVSVCNRLFLSLAVVELVVVILLEMLE